MGQHRIKKKVDRKERELAHLASLIADQLALEFLLAQAGPYCRGAVLDKYRPHLRFTPAPDTLERVHARLSRKETPAAG